MVSVLACFFLKQALKARLKYGMACVVYAQCPLSAQAALTARVSLEQRVIMVTHFNVSQADEWVGKGLISKDRPLYSSIQHFESDVLPRVDGLVFVSKYIQNELFKRVPAITSVSSVVVPNFLPDPGLPDSQSPTADLINIGTLETRKNQQYLLEIVAALRDLGTPLTLTIVGDGVDKPMLEAKAKALKVEKLVHFTGFINKAAEQIGTHKAYIHVATMESFGITLIEAMARGRPIFAVPVGGVSELIDNGVYSLALPINDAKNSARKIAEAIQNEQWMAQASVAAREQFVTKYASTIAATRLTKFLHGEQ